MPKFTSNIPNFSRYYVTEGGKVIRISTLRELKSHLHHHTHRDILHLTNDQGEKKNMKVSRLVALAWIPNPENKPCVCHKDNNPLNNHKDNLYWGTHKENSEQMVRDGRSTRGYTFKHPNPWPRGYGNPNFRLSLENLAKLRDYLKHPSKEYKQSLIKELKVSRRSLDRYLQHIREGYYGKV